MFSLFTVLLAFRMGTIPSHGDAGAPSLRAEVLEVASQSALSPAALLDPAPVWSAAPHAPAWPAAQGSGPAVGPIFPAYRPEEWVSLVARNLDLADHPITHAALFVAAIPVQLDVSRDHFYGKVTFRLP